MATFYNQASLTFRNVVRNSNITEGEIVDAIELTKTAVSADYGAGDGITYAISLTNSGAGEVTGITLTDNLGVYTVPGGTTEVVPLTYVEDSILYYINGELQAAPAVTAGDTLVIEDISIPSGGNALIIYEVRANEFAPLSAGSSIYNSVTANGACEDLSASASIGTRDEALLNIAKAVSPAVITNCGEVTYTFIVQNYGNTDAVATDDIIISDTFNPILSDITVTLNGETLTEGTDYTYDEATGEFATVASVVTVPAATFSRDSETGVVTTTPGVAVLVVTGNL